MKLTQRWYAYPLLLIIIGLLVFQSVFFKGFIFDDKTQIITNSAVHSINSIPSFFISSLHYSENVTWLTGFTYRPIMYSIFTLLYAVGHGQPFVFHLFLLLVFIINVMLVYFIFTKFTTRQIAFLASLLFLVHPANMEIATYIADIQDALYFFFGASALLVIISNHAFQKRLWLAAGLLLLSCLAKETGLLFVLAVFIYTLVFKKQYFVQSLCATILVMIVYFALRTYAGQTPFLTIEIPAISTLQYVDNTTRLLLVPNVLFFYLTTIVMPLPALPLVFLKTVPLFQSILSLLIILGAYAGLAGIGKVVKRKNQKYFKGYIFFFCIFIITSLFHSQLIPLDVLISKRWLYMQLFTILGMMCILLQTFSGQLKPYKKWLVIFYVCYFVILLIETQFMLTYY